MFYTLILEEDLIRILNNLALSSLTCMITIGLSRGHSYEDIKDR